MSFVQNGRIGLTPEISGFVTREDEELRARLKRLAVGASSPVVEPVAALRQKLTESWAAITAPARSPEAADDAVCAESDAPSPADLSDAGAEPKAGRDWGKTARIHLAAALIRGHQLAVLTLAFVKPGERLRDLGALSMMTLAWSGRAALAAPRWLQVFSLIGIGLYLAPWPEAPVAGFALIEPATSNIRVRDTGDGLRAVQPNLAAYHLEAPELDRTAPRYRMRRLSSGARQDLMSWHEDLTPADRPRNRLSGAVSVEYFPAERPAAETLFVDVARRAAQFGHAVERISDAVLVHNKFGAFEVAEAELSQTSGNRTCLAFRHVAEEVPLQVQGWFCGAAQRTLDRASLACLLDRIDLLGAGSDQTLRAYFASVERNRRPCGTYRAISAPNGWVDSNGRMPELKTAFSDLPRRQPGE